MVCDFVYDGKGPDAFFIVGNKNSPNPRDAKPGKDPDIRQLPASQLLSLDNESPKNAKPNVVINYLIYF